MAWGEPILGNEKSPLLPFEAVSSCSSRLITASSIALRHASPWRWLSLSLDLQHDPADHHVLKHAPAQCADAHIGHGMLPSEPRLCRHVNHAKLDSTHPTPRPPQPKSPACEQRSTARAVSFVDPTWYPRDPRSERGAWACRPWRLSGLVPKHFNRVTEHLCFESTFRRWIWLPCSVFGD